MTAPPSSRRRATLRVAGLALLWGSSFLWIKLALRGLSPVQIVLVRLALGAAVLLVVVRVQGLRLPRGRMVWVHLAVAALVANVIPYVLFAVGEQSVPSSLAGALNATTPMFTVLLALAVREEKQLRCRRLAGLLLGLAGGVVILQPWTSTHGVALGGAVACLGAAASYAVSYLYMSRYLAHRGLPPLVLAAAQLLAATGWLVLLTPIAGRQPIHLAGDVLAGALILGALGTGAAYALNYRIVTDEGPTAASAVTYLLPVVSVILGIVALNEPLTPGLVLGGIAVLAGVTLVRQTPH